MQYPGADSQDAGWETVAGKSKPVPSSGRKHSLAPSSSPGDSWQMPKALKEAPPSPMQTSEPSSLSSGAGVEHRHAPPHPAIFLPDSNEDCQKAF